MLLPHWFIHIIAKYMPHILRSYLPTQSNVFTTPAYKWYASTIQRSRLHWNPGLFEHTSAESGLPPMEVFTWVTPHLFPPSFPARLAYFLSPSFDNSSAFLSPPHLNLSSHIFPLTSCGPAPPSQYTSDLNFSHKRHTNHHRKIISLQESTMTSQYKHGKKN